MNVTKAVNDRVDHHLRELPEAAVPEYGPLLDSVFRPFLHQMQTFQDENADPATVQHCVIALLANMMAEVMVATTPPEHLGTSLQSACEQLVDNAMEAAALHTAYMAARAGH